MMAETLFKSLLEGQVSIKDVTEWLSSDGDELKVADENNRVCSKGEFVLYISNLLRQSFISADHLNNTSSKSLNKHSKTGENIVKNKEKSNQTKKVLKAVKVLSLKPQKTPTLIQDVPVLRKEDRSGLSHTFSPPETKPNHGEVLNSSFKSSESSFLRTPPRPSFHGENNFLTPIQRKQQSAERDTRLRNSDTKQSSPVVDSRLKNNNRSLTLGDFIKESPNQKKRQSYHTPKSEKIATSTPSRDSEKTGDSNPSSPAWYIKKPQRRINPTKILSFDDDKSPKIGFPKDETFGVVARSQGQSSFETQADINMSQGSISFAEERSLLMDERQKLQNKSIKLTPPKLTTLSNAPAKTSIVTQVADPCEVTFKDHLLLLCDLYSNIIDANLIPNIMTELHFVLTLLVVQKSSLKKVKKRIAIPSSQSQSAESEKISNLIKEKLIIESELEDSIINTSNISFDKEKSCDDISKEEKDVINSEEKKVDKDIGKWQNDSSLTDTSNCLMPNNSDSNCVLPLPSGDKVECSAHLDTVHNCVFFATNLLWRQKHLLAHLDRVTMKLLLDNERVTTFMPDLALAIQDMYTKASPRTTGAQNTSATSVVYNCSASKTVTFHSERDSSTNFESSNAFRSFRKQRDLFYGIFQTWEVNHLNPAWIFSASLKHRIRALLEMCRDSTNYMHLARLFRMQLEAAVMGGKSLSDDLDSSFLECLRGVDPEKLSRLRERLVTPHSSEGPRPPPQFPGQQEFFREFIMAVDNASFIEHLKDNLVSHLLELNQTNYCASDVEESDLVVDEETRQAYIHCVTTMQLLAKFLGFIVFLPYQKTADVPRNIIEAELEIRSRVGPPLNVMTCVVDAWTNRRLVVTLPWVVQYLGMLDEGSVELPFYRNTIVLLLNLYAGLARDIGKGYPFAPGEMAPKSVMLLRLLLGWLFESPCLPDGLLFLWKRTCIEQDYLQGTPDNSLIVKRSHRENVPCLNWSSSLGGASATPVDSLELVDTVVLYAVCPFLLGLRGLLSTVQEANANASGTVRHITPVSTALIQPEPVSTAQLELQLEENFFHGLPESVQKTVEFVVERVTSACIKQICNTLIPDLKGRGMTEFKNAIAEEILNGPNAATEKKLTERRDLVVKQVVAEMRSKCNEYVEKICCERCRAALTALLSQVSLPLPVCEMCIAISSRLSTERVTAWFRTHATFKTYAADLQDELKKALCDKGADKEASAAEKTSHLASFPDRKHDDTAPSPGEVLIDFRELVCDILETHGEGITQQSVDKIIDDVDRLIRDRADVTPAAERTFSALLLDLSVALVCHSPDLVTDSFIEKVIALWKNDALRPTDNSLSRIICPRNVLLLAQSSHPATKVWHRLAQIVGVTLNEQLVTADDVELQCLAILHQVWPQDVLMNFSSCVSEIVRVYRKKSANVDTEKFEYLLNWLADITKYMEDYPD